MSSVALLAAVTAGRARRKPRRRLVTAGINGAALLLFRFAELVAADCGIDGLGVIDNWHSDIALPDRPSGHFEHTLQRDARARHDVRRQVDPRLEIAKR